MLRFISEAKGCPHHPQGDQKLLQLKKAQVRFYCLWPNLLLFFFKYSMAKLNNIIAHNLR